MVSPQCQSIDDRLLEFQLNPSLTLALGHRVYFTQGHDLLKEPWLTQVGIQSLLLQFGTALIGHPSSRALCRTCWGLKRSHIMDQFLPLFNSAFHTLLQVCLQVNFLHVFSVVNYFFRESSFRHSIFISPLSLTLLTLLFWSECKIASTFIWKQRALVLCLCNSFTTIWYGIILA